MASPEEPQTRNTLKKYFQEGKMPTQRSFEHLIDSAVNRLDDGFYRHPVHGLQLDAADERPATKGQPLLSLYRNLQQLQLQCASWLLSLLAPDHEPAGAPGLGFVEPYNPRAGSPAEGTDAARPVRLFLAPGGNVGIGTTSPGEQLSVAGFVGSAGRIGTFQNEPYPGVDRPASAPRPAHAAPREAPADGEWYVIVDGLRGLWGFEIVAAAYGPRNEGTYAMAHAIALGVHGQPQRIAPHRAAYRGWRQQIQFRWQITTRGTREQPVPVYQLQMRTRRPFGVGASIVFHVTCLYDNCQPRSWAAD